MTWICIANLASISCKLAPTWWEISIVAPNNIFTLLRFAFARSCVVIAVFFAFRFTSSGPSITFSTLSCIDICMTTFTSSNHMIYAGICNKEWINTEIFAFIAVLAFKLLSRKILFINRKDNRNCLKSYFFKKQQNPQVNYCKIKIVGMRNFQNTFETHKRSFLSPFSISMTITLIKTV